MLLLGALAVAPRMLVLEKAVALSSPERTELYDLSYGVL